MLEQIEDNKHWYDLVIRASGAGIWDWDIANDAIHYSDRLMELLGYTEGELSGTIADLWNLIHPDDKDATHELLEAYLEKRRDNYTIDYRLRAKSGVYLWFHSHGLVLRDDVGNPVRMAGSLIDINERKIAQEQILASESQFRELMEQSPMAMEILSPDGKITTVNSAWKRLWNVDEKATKDVMDTYNMLTDPQIEQLGIADLVKKAFEGKHTILPPIQYSATQVAEDFNLIGLEELKTPWIQCHLHSVMDQKGEISFVVNTYMDITALKNIQDELQVERETLAKIDRSTRLGQLTASIAHELNQPLSGVLSNAQAAQILVSRKDYSELPEILVDIVSDLKRAGNVIQNLRDVYTDQKVEFESIDLKQIVMNTMNLFKSELIADQIKLEVEYDPNCTEAFGNTIQIQQVLVNLIMNAIQAMSNQDHTERKIRIVTGYQAPFVQVSVIDSGPGIAQDHIAQIIEPFITSKDGGSGMGLAICNSIIAAHNGHISVENMNNRGAKVSFTIPTHDLKSSNE